MSDNSNLSLACYGFFFRREIGDRDGIRSIATDLHGVWLRRINAPLESIALDANRVEDLTARLLDDLNDRIDRAFKHQFRKPARNFASVVGIHRNGDRPTRELL